MGSLHLAFLGNGIAEFGQKTGRSPDTGSFFFIGRSMGDLDVKQEPIAQKTKRIYVWTSDLKYSKILFVTKDVDFFDTIRSKLEMIRRC